jgi:NitT/TauT family transport system substrate-binding protein
MSGRLMAAYMLAPLIMDLADNAIPVKVVSLGHRSGAVIMVRTDSSYRNFKDLAGKRVAVPSRFAVDYLFLRKMLAREGMTLKDVDVVRWPTRHAGSSYAKRWTRTRPANPSGRSRSARLARPLSMTRDSGRTTSLRPDRARRAGQGESPVGAAAGQLCAGRRRCWIAPANRTKAVQIAAGPKFFNQDPNVLRFVMDNPSDRVTYGDLRLIRSEFEELMQLSIAAGTIKRNSRYENYVDESFVRNIKPVSITL